MPAQKHQSQSVSDPVAHALNRVFNHAVSNGKSAEAYLCSLRIPSMFSNAPKTANTIYKKTMSDYCKGVMRLPDGETPRYVAVASEQNGFPLYKFCLFAKPGLDLNAEDGVGAWQIHRQQQGFGVRLRERHFGRGPALPPSPPLLGVGTNRRQ